MLWPSIAVGLLGVLWFFRASLWDRICTCLGWKPVVELFLCENDERWRSAYKCIAPVSRGHVIYREKPLCIGYMCSPHAMGILTSPVQEPIAHLAVQIIIQRRTAPTFHWSNMRDFYPGPKDAHSDLVLEFYRRLTSDLKAEFSYNDISLIFRQLWLHARPLFPRRMALFAATAYLPHADQPSCFLHHEGEKLCLRPLRDLSKGEICSVNWIPLRASMENPQKELEAWNLDPTAAPCVPPRAALFDTIGATETQEDLMQRCHAQVEALEDRWPQGTEHIGDVSAWAAEIFHCVKWAQQSLEHRSMYYGATSTMAKQARTRLRVLESQSDGSVLDFADTAVPSRTRSPKKIGAGANTRKSTQSKSADLLSLMTKLQLEKDKLEKLAHVIRSATVKSELPKETN